jgi:hypothetical protein
MTTAFAIRLAFVAIVCAAVALTSWEIWRDRK